MEQLISTKFYLALQEASHSGIDIVRGALNSAYDEFAVLVFNESKTAIDRATYGDMLVYTIVELSCLTPVSKKKCGSLSR
jgi:hypothetical protein